jgi:hypothetical protein
VILIGSLGGAVFTTATKQAGNLDIDGAIPGGTEPVQSGYQRIRRAWLACFRCFGGCFLIFRADWTHTTASFSSPLLSLTADRSRGLDGPGHARRFAQRLIGYHGKLSIGKS